MPLYRKHLRRSRDAPIGDVRQIPCCLSPLRPLGAWAKRYARVLLSKSYFQLSQQAIGSSIYWMISTAVAIQRRATQSHCRVAMGGASDQSTIGNDGVFRQTAKSSLPSIQLQSN
jgi:hypothetical protein